MLDAVHACTGASTRTGLYTVPPTYAGFGPRSNLLRTTNRRSRGVGSLAIGHPEIALSRCMRKHVFWRKQPKWVSNMVPKHHMNGHLYTRYMPFWPLCMPRGQKITFRGGTMDWSRAIPDGSTCPNRLRTRNRVRTPQSTLTSVHRLHRCVGS